MGNDDPFYVVVKVDPLHDRLVDAPRTVLFVEASTPMEAATRALEEFRGEGEYRVFEATWSGNYWGIPSTVERMP